jgi:integrase
VQNGSSSTPEKLKGGKTGSRPVPLSPAAVKFFERLAKGKKADDWLLTRDDGKQWQHSDWDGLLKDAVRLAKLPDETVLYTMRHSWSIDALNGGLSTLLVARITGTSVMIIEKHYGHLVSDFAIEQLAKIQMT